MELISIYGILMKEYGPQNWWPVSPFLSKRKVLRSPKKLFTYEIKPMYTGGPKTDKERLEVCIGAILTQNTSWKNAEKAIVNLNWKNLIDLKKLKNISREGLEEIIKPSGFFKQKTDTLKTFVNFISDEKFENITRDKLLKLKGIGPETADSILLYAFGKPEFVVDAYTKRIFNRLGIIDGQNYNKIKCFFQDNFPKDVQLYQEFHALIVEHAKRFCKKRPECDSCPLRKICDYYKRRDK